MGHAHLAGVAPGGRRAAAGLQPRRGPGQRQRLPRAGEGRGHRGTPSRPGRTDAVPHPARRGIRRQALRLLLHRRRRRPVPEPLRAAYGGRRTVQAHFLRARRLSSALVPRRRMDRLRGQRKRVRGRPRVRRRRRSAPSPPARDQRRGPAEGRDHRTALGPAHGDPLRRDFGRGGPSNSHAGPPGGGRRQVLRPRQRLRPSQSGRRQGLSPPGVVHRRAARRLRPSNVRPGLRDPPPHLANGDPRGGGLRQGRGDGRGVGRVGRRVVFGLNPLAHELRRQPAQLLVQLDDDVRRRGPGRRERTGGQQGQPRPGPPVLDSRRGRPPALRARDAGGGGPGVPSAVLRPRVHVRATGPLDRALRHRVRGHRNREPVPQQHRHAAEGEGAGGDDRVRAFVLFRRPAGGEPGRGQRLHRGRGAGGDRRVGVVHVPGRLAAPLRRVEQRIPDCGGGRRGRDFQPSRHALGGLHADLRPYSRRGPVNGRLVRGAAGGPGVRELGAADRVRGGRPGARRRRGDGRSRRGVGPREGVEHRGAGPSRAGLQRGGGAGVVVRRGAARTVHRRTGRRARERVVPLARRRAAGGPLATGHDLPPGVHQPGVGASGGPARAQHRRRRLRRPMDRQAGGDGPRVARLALRAREGARLRPVRRGAADLPAKGRRGRGRRGGWQ